MIQEIPDFNHSHAGSVCHLCKMPKREGDRVLDLGFVIPFEGGVALCSTCIGYMGGLVGLASAAAVAELEAQVEDLAARLAAATLAVEAAAEREAVLAAQEATLSRLLDPPKPPVAKPKVSARA